MSLIILLIIISSGSILCTAICGKKYEETLPITCTTIVMWLFLCGIVGQLKIGSYALIIISGAVYLGTLAIVIKKKNFKDFLHNVLTPGCVVFLIFYFVIAYATSGKMLDGFDEFTHWGTVVKVMVLENSFGTATSLETLLFQSYPPGIALFQYFVQEVHYLVSGQIFLEGRLYAAFQILFVAYMMPFFRNLSFKKPVVILVTMVSSFVAPLLFFPTVYSQIYVDPFLGMLSGVGLAMIFLNRKKDIFYSITIWSIIIMLILTKDAGVLFAVFLAITYSISWMRIPKNRGIQRLVPPIVSVLAILFPKALWNLHLSLTDTNIMFSGKVDFRELVAILLGKVDNYRTTVFRNFPQKLVQTRVPIGNFNWGINYVLLFILCLIILYIVYRVYKNKDAEYSFDGRLLIGVLCVQTLIYVVGLCVSYMYKFSEYEALLYASFERYMNIVYLVVWMVIVLVINNGLMECKRTYIIPIGIFCLIMCVVPTKDALSYLKKVPVKSSIERRWNYEMLDRQIRSIAEPSKIYLISQEDYGFDKWVIRHNAYPHIVTSSLSYSFRDSEKYYDSDIWSREVELEVWQQELIENYDYVALFRVNNYFVDTYRELFEDYDLIQNSTVFKINKETGMLQSIQN